VVFRVRIQNVIQLLAVVSNGRLPFSIRVRRPEQSQQPHHPALNWFV
jgi:hypothetical protein